MTPRRRNKHKLERIVATLRDADAMPNARMDLAVVLRALEISETTRACERARRRREAVVKAG